MTASFTFAHDANFNFPADDPAWREFFEAHSVELSGYYDMAKLTEDLKAHSATVSYLPAANYYHLRHDPFYRPIANARYAADGSTRMTALLVVSKASGVTTLEQLRGRRLAYVHPYCTTSYFAPVLFLAEHGDSIRDFFAELVEVPAWQPQIDAVLEGKAEATFVQENVWLARPENDEQTLVIGRQENLPSPVVIAAAGADEAFVAQFSELLLSHRPELTPTTLFDGFVPYEHDQVQQFLATAERALSVPATA